MNAILFLIKEHNRFRKTFSEIKKSSHKEATKRKMLAELCQELTRHETMEQTVWYPYLKQNKQLTPIIKHLVSEEKSADKFIKQFHKIKSYDEWEAKFLEFKKDISHHATEEETKFFPKVKKICSASDLLVLGRKMYRFKKEYGLKLAA